MKLIRIFLEFFKDLFSNRNIIWELVKRDMKTSYVGSFLGILWTFIHPFALTLIFMLIFGLGFRSGAPIGEVPFFIWFLAGYIPWIFFSSSISANTNCINSFSYLVKKLNFRISIIPMIKLLTNIVIFLIYIISLMIFMLIWSVPISLYIFQIFYYFIAMFILIMGSSYLLSSTNVFIKDIGNVNSILLQLGFFATPIFWSIDNVAPEYQIIFRINPMLYIVQGFRDSLFNFEPFWTHLYETIYFWSFTGLITILGVFVFIKLRPHFADVV